MSNKMEGGYQLTRNLFDWCFENPDLINTNDIALYLWLVEKNNRCGWVEKMSVTASESMAACGFKTYPPYKKSFDKLIELGFIIMIKKSLNQYQCNIVALSKNNKATNKALDKASLKHSRKHLYSNRESTFDINKQRNNETNKPLNNETKDGEIKISPPADLVYSECMKIYNDFILDKTSLPAKIDGQQGKALKGIINYFKSIENVKSGERSVQDCIAFVFKEWDRVEPFIKDKLKLSEINSNLTNIINQIKNGKSNSALSKQQQVTEHNADQLRRVLNGEL